MDAIAGVDLVLARRIETFAKQPRDRFGIVERPASAHADAAHSPIDAEQADFEPPAPLGLAIEQNHELLRELADRSLDIPAPRDPRGAAPFGGRIGRGTARRTEAALQPT